MGHRAWGMGHRAWGDTAGSRLRLMASARQGGQKTEDRGQRAE
jgi:hypothetical protein